MVSITDNDLLLAKIRFYRIYPSYFYVDPKLSGAQTTFNRLNKKIAKLKMIIDELPQREHVIKKYFDEKRREALEEIRQDYIQISTGLSQEEINKKGLESM